MLTSVILIWPECRSRSAIGISCRYSLVMRFSAPSDIFWWTGLIIGVFSVRNCMQIHLKDDVRVETCQDIVSHNTHAAT